VPVGHETTLFQLWRDWFAWVSVGLLAWVVARTAGPSAHPSWAVIMRTPEN